MLRHFFKKKAGLALLSAVLLLSAACTEDYVCPVPNVDRFEFYLTMPSHEVMVSKMVSRTSTGAKCGYNGHGVVVFRYSSEDIDVFAFDATCPSSEACMSSAKGYVKDDTYGHGVCQNCGSSYSLVDGRHSDKKIMLRPYSVQRMGIDYYRIGNY
jgi:opacity protein-like surface antigen